MSNKQLDLNTGFEELSVWILAQEPERILDEGRHIRALELAFLWLRDEGYREYSTKYVSKIFEGDHAQHFAFLLGLPRGGKPVTFGDLAAMLEDYKVYFLIRIKVTMSGYEKYVLHAIQATDEKEARKQALMNECHNIPEWQLDGDFNECEDGDYFHYLVTCTKELTQKEYNTYQELTDWY